MRASPANPLGTEFHDMYPEQKLRWLKEQLNDMVDNTHNPVPQGAILQAAHMGKDEGSSIMAVREATMEELQKREDGCREKFLDACHRFANYPSRDNWDLLASLSKSMQTTWMEGRKRVSVL